jgi:hypothetical protein
MKMGLLHEFKELLTYPGSHRSANAQQMLQTHPSLSSVVAYKALYSAMQGECSQNPLHIRAVVQEFLQTSNKTIGGCVDSCNKLMEYLESHGIWCYGLAGSCELFPENRSIPASGFFEINHQTPVGHHWVVVPPFMLLDCTLSYNFFPPELQNLIPPFILEERVMMVKPVLESLQSAEITELIGRQLSMSEISGLLKIDVAEFWHTFPAMRLETSGLVMVYTPVRVIVSDNKPHQIYANNQVLAITRQSWNDVSTRTSWSDVSTRTSTFNLTTI